MKSALKLNEKQFKVEENEFKIKKIFWIRTTFFSKFNIKLKEN